MSGKAIAGMAMDAVGSVINNLNNELQMERTFGFNERAAKNSDARTRALFTDLYSPEAKVQQLKDAGLSVGMMYGQGGVSGTSSTQGAQGAGAGNQQAAQMNLSKQLELGMMTAQIKALEAGANKDNADAKDKEQDRLLKVQQTLKLGEEITEVKAKAKARRYKMRIRRLLFWLKSSHIVTGKQIGRASCRERV